MSDDWDDYAGDWDTNPGVVLYADHTYETLCAEIDLTGLNILDFGCGTGNLAQKMAKAADQIVAVDSSAKMIAILNEKKINTITALHLELSQGVISDKFDLITASSVFAFVDDFEETLGLLKTLLKPGGKLLQWDWLAQDDDGEFGFSKGRLETAYANAGFKDIKISQPFSLEKPSGTRQVIMCSARIV